MKKLLILTAVILLAGINVFGQSTLGSVGEPDAANIGTDTAQQSLKEVSVTKFEDAGFWDGSMPGDQGVTVIRRLPGNPQGKKAIPDEEKAGITEDDKFVLGMKIEYYRRGHSEFSLHPVKPIPIEGICKTLSLWVVGRNTNHTLKMLISDQFGNHAELTMGKLNFTGWKRMTVAVPTNIVQRDYHYNNRMGIKVEGFRVICDPVETYGQYYIYFDDLRATTDLFAEENRDVDDMMDVW